MAAIAFGLLLTTREARVSKMVVKERERERERERGGRSGLSGIMRTRTLLLEMLLVQHLLLRGIEML
jgi:hypothetical protein